MDPIYKHITGSSWQKAETYVYAAATYVVACPPDRRCQVGMGIYAFGEPRGEKVRFSGELEVTVVGAGALWFRVADDKGPCQVGFVQKSNRPISWTWSL
ncbi:MAG: hypothetical protein O9327_02395 [Polaromonas sp.]|nr:hypothetical protein [Polaromonas sp.]